MGKVRIKEGVVAEEVNSSKKKTGTVFALGQSERCLEDNSGIGRASLISGSRYKRVNSFERLCVEKRAPG
jgi:hypothetical protein